MADLDNPWANGENQAYGPWAARPKPYAPPEAQDAAPVRVQQPQQDLSFSAFAKQTGYDGLSIEEQAKLHQKYRSEILPMVAQVHGGRVANWQKEFDAAVPAPVKPKRSGVEMFTDPLVGLAAGVTGLAKSATDFVDPSSRASKFLGEVTDDIRGNYSAVEKDAERVRAGDQRRIDADTSLGGIQKFGVEAKSALKNMSVGQLAELVGNILPTMLATGGVGLAARGLGAGAKGVQAATMGAGAVTGAVGAGGDAAGSAYEAVMNMPADKLMQAPEYQELVSRLGEAKAREALAMGAARTAQIPGTALGAFFGPLGAEAALGKRLAGQQAGGRLATAGKEAFLSEVPEEVGTTMSGNYGTQQVDPTQRLMQGTGQAAVLAAIGGGGAGLIAGGGKALPQQTLEDQLLNGEAPPAQPAEQQPGTLTLGYDKTSGGLGWNPNGLAGGAGTVAGVGVPGFNPEQAIAEAATMGGALGGRIAENNLRFLDSAWRTGGEAAVRELAQQVNTIGVAARRFIAALDASRVQRQLGAPDPVLGLPSPEDPSGIMVAGPDGVNMATNREAQQMRRDADVWRQKQQETGLTNDVIQAQADRTASQETQEGAQGNEGAVSGPGGESGSAVGELGNVGADGQSLKHVVLQNRDREGAASIAQMQQIASNPDYNRVSISRQLGEGSPVVIDEVNLPEAQRGREEVAVDGQGRSIRTRYAVVEAADLLASHTADGQAVKGYERGEGGKMRAVAGNGRVAGIQRAYTNGRATPYRTAMQFDQLHGVDPQVIAGMDSPVLVRTMSPVDVTADIGDRTNTTGVSQLSPVEQAKNDARRVDVAKLEYTDDGDPTPDAIRRFVQGMPESERGNLLQTDGQPGRQATDRLMGAVFWKAYGDADLVQLYAQATDPEAKTVLNALADAAGPMAQLAGTAVDIRDVVTEAAKAAVNAKRKGLKLADFARTQDMTMTTDTQAVVDFFAQNIRSAKRIGEGLRSAAQFALDNQGGSDMFGDVPPASRADVVNQLRGQDDTRTTQSDADAGRGGPAAVDAGRNGGTDGADQQSPGAGPEADPGQGQDLDALFDEALEAAAPAKAEGTLPKRMNDALQNLKAEIDSAPESATSPRAPEKKLPTAPAVRKQIEKREAEAKKEAEAPPASSDLAQWDRRRLAAEAVRKSTVRRTNANSVMVWQIIDENGNAVSGPPGVYPGRGALAGTQIAGDRGWKTKREADAALAELNRKANEILGQGLTAPTPDQIRATEEAKAAAARAEKAAKAADDARAKLEQERKEIAQRSEAAADTFELGQDPMANLTGQKDLLADDGNVSPKPAKNDTTEKRVDDTSNSPAINADNGIQKDADLPTGTIIRDKDGKKYRVHYMRWDLLVTHPIVNGKPDVSADTSVRFRLSDNKDPDSSERSGPVFLDNLPDKFVMRNGKAVHESRTGAATALPNIDASLQTMFEGLDGRGLKKTNAQKKLAKAGADAQYVQEHWLDILQDLEDRGVLKINCK